MIHKLSHLTPLDYEDFARIIIKAKEMFMRSTNGQEILKKKLEVMRDKHKDKEELLRRSYKLIMEKYPDFVINEPSVNSTTTAANDTKSTNTADINTTTTSTMPTNKIN